MPIQDPGQPLPIKKHPEPIDYTPRSESLRLTGAEHRGGVEGVIVVSPYHHHKRVGVVITEMGRVGAIAILGHTFEDGGDLLG